MQAFLTRQFHSIAIIGLILLAGTAYYAGFLEGKRAQSSTVVLSCSDTTLQTLEIPAATLANADNKSTINSTDLTASATPQGKYVGSRNGTKYYLPTCTSAKRIKVENRVWFNTIEDATLQGYTPGKC